MFKKDEGGQGAETVIANGVKVEGDFVSPGNVRIEGIVKGSVRADGDLVVTETAAIEANIEAANASVSGEIRGNIIVTEKLELHSTARVYGDINAKILSVDAGAHIDGRCAIAVEHTPVRVREPKTAEA